MSIYRRSLPITITAILATLLIVQYFFGFGNAGKSLVTVFSNWNVILYTMATALGLINLSVIHSRRIINKSSGQWPYSLLLLITMISFIFIGLVYRPESETYEWLYMTTLGSITTAVYATAVLLMASATYRAFRVRTWRSWVLLIGFLIVTLGNSSMIEAIFPPLTDLQRWYVATPNMAGQRAILIGGAVGAISLGIRTIIGKERGVIGAD
ncbi:MAG: hypothetical protein ACFFDT_00655 [Candidatus Hodarchaeota archaeon]